jgi:hypothetical protein
MELEEIKKEVDNYDIKQSSTTDFLSLNNKKGTKTVKDYLIKYGKIFGTFVCFKLIFKLVRNLDKSANNSISLYRFYQIVLDISNIKYGMVIVLIKILFRLFRKLLNILKLDNLLEYKRLNLLFGLLCDIILIPLGKKSTIIFYSMVYYLIKNLSSLSRDHLYSSNRREYKESKQVYFIGLSLGFILFSLLKTEYRTSIKLIN